MFLEMIYWWECVDIEDLVVSCVFLLFGVESFVIDVSMN